MASKRKGQKKSADSSEKAEANVDEAAHDAEKISDKAACLDEGARDTE